VHKVVLGNQTTVTVNTTYNLKMQCKGDLFQIFLDGKPRISYYTQVGSPLGTKFGLYRLNSDDGSVFDNWLVKAL
jgi:hypothetical protein